MTSKPTKTNEQEPTRPELFSAAIYKVLQIHIRSSVNYNQILLCMCDYKGCDISTQHSKNEPYSHVIVVCIKFLKGHLCQPIGSLIYQRDRLDESISAIIKMLRMYVETLNELGYVILGSVSTCDIIFERIFGYLVDICPQSEEGVLSPMIYEIGSTRLVHVFDIFCLYSKFTTKWTEHDIYSYNGYEFDTSSWSYIHIAQKCFLNKVSIERFQIAEVPINLKLLCILTRQIVAHKMHNDGINAVVILENMTHLIILCCTRVLASNIGFPKIRDALMNYARWLHTLYFKKKKSSLTNISIQPPSNFYYFCTSAEDYKYYNLYCSLEATQLSENIFDETVSYVSSLIDQELFPLSTRNFFTRDLTHLKSEIDNGTLEDVPFVSQMIQTILGILEIVPSFPKVQWQNLTGSIFDVQPVTCFMHHVLNEKNKIETSPYIGVPYVVIDVGSAYEIFNRHDGALMVTYNTTTNS